MKTKIDLPFLSNHSFNAIYGPLCNGDTIKVKAGTLVSQIGSWGDRICVQTAEGFCRWCDPQDLENTEMIIYEFLTPSGNCFKRGTTKNKKSLMEIKYKANRAYGAHLVCKAKNEKGEAVFIFN